MVTDFSRRVTSEDDPMIETGHFIQELYAVL